MDESGSANRTKMKENFMVVSLAISVRQVIRRQFLSALAKSQNCLL
jgi:hypothetical protein